MVQREVLSLILPNPNIPAERTIPNDDDVQRMVQVIEAEPLLISGQLVCRSAGHCAMGALMFAAGITNEEMATDGIANDVSEEQPEYVARRLYDWYRLDQEVAIAIMNANDNHGEDVRRSWNDDATELVPTAPFKPHHPSIEGLRDRRKMVIQTIRDEVENQRRLNRPSDWKGLNINGMYDDDDDPEGW